MKKPIKCLALAAALLVPSAPAFASQQQPASSSSASTAPKKKTVSKKHRSKRESTQRAPTPARISEIQSALARDGYYQGQPNGKWDSNTVAAMQKFQSGNGLEASGKLNALSLQKLGLGSSVAGVSAPKPVQPATSKSPASSPSSTAPVPAPRSTNSGANSPQAANAASASTVAKPPQR
ncbi:MAG TPA: peptidoglycan-binding domain-containing protein [Candidatus Acidoferrales bacterium]|nr:peptidoglycan-binding domain-containing protein [Candidatus Acidoferrales bacterium]